MKIIDIENWKRKEHFEFFSKLANPSFGITTEVDCTIAYEEAKSKERSFFAHYFHKSMIAVNTVEELKLRLVDDKVVLFDTIDAGTTISREDGTFGFIYVPFSPDFEIFNKELQREINEVQNSTGLRLKNEDLTLGLIRHSTLPWSHFSALLNPTNLDNKDTVPKIVFGKFAIREGKKYLPVAIEAHHGLADGLHITQYLNEFQEELNKTI